MKKWILLMSALLFSCGDVTSTSSINAWNEQVESINSYAVEANQIIKKDPIKIYLNPSVQIHNLYYDQKTTEAEMMNKISKVLYQNLSSDERICVYQNDRYLPLDKSIEESNDLGVKYHIALHSNAGGGSGSELYYGGNQKFANSLYNSYNTCHPFAARGVKKGGNLYEIAHSKAENRVLIELLFHDNKTEADYLINNYEKIALTLSYSIKDYLNLN